MSDNKTLTAENSANCIKNEQQSSSVAEQPRLSFSDWKKTQEEAAKNEQRPAAAAAVPVRKYASSQQARNNTQYSQYTQRQYATGYEPVAYQRGRADSFSRDATPWQQFPLNMNSFIQPMPQIPQVQATAASPMIHMPNSCIMPYANNYNNAMMMMRTPASYAMMLPMQAQMPQRRTNAYNSSNNNGNSKQKNSAARQRTQQAKAKPASAKTPAALQANDQQQANSKQNNKETTTAQQKDSQKMPPPPVPSSSSSLLEKQKITTPASGSGKRAQLPIPGKKSEADLYEKETAQQKDAQNMPPPTLPALASGGGGDGKRVWLPKPEMPPHMDVNTPEDKEEKQRLWREYRIAMKPFKNREFLNAKRTVQRLGKKSDAEMDEKEQDRLQRARDIMDSHKAMLNERHCQYTRAECLELDVLAPGAKAQIYVLKPEPNHWQRPRAAAYNNVGHQYSSQYSSGSSRHAVQPAQDHDFGWGPDRTRSEHKNKPINFIQSGVLRMQ